MSLTDTTELANVKATQPQMPRTYKREMWQDLQDFNNGSHPNSIDFDTRNFISKKVVYSESYLAIPLDLQCRTSGTTFSEAAVCKVALKSSLLSLIYGLNITTNDQQLLVQENDLNLINNLRLMVENNVDWMNAEGRDIHFAKDTNYSRLFSPVTTETCVFPAVGTTANTSTSSGALIVSKGLNLPIESTILNQTTSPTFAQANAGFAQRIKFVKEESSLSSSSLKFTAYIPLKYIHDFFNQMNFPITNLSLIINFIHGLSSTATTDFTPFMVGYGTSPVLDTNGDSIISGTCRLIMKVVELNAEDEAAYSSMLSSGFEKEFKYLVQQTYRRKAQTATSFADVITPSAINPKRLWVVGYPANYLKYQSTKTTGYTAEDSTIGYGSCQTPTVLFKNVQIQIDGTNYYERNLDNTSIDSRTRLDHWRIMKQQFPILGQGKGAIINYSDFLTWNRFHVYDLSRLNEFLPTNNVNTRQIYYQADRAIGTGLSCITQANYDSAGTQVVGASTETTADSADYYFILERLRVVKFSVKNGTWSIVCGETQR